MEKSKLKILFIINPVSGTRRKKDIASKIYECVNNETFDIKLIFTEYAGHAFELARNALKKKFDIVVAGGGDGTVNEVGSALIKSKIALGIIPLGSGNGLARHLNIPLRTTDAIEIINKQKIQEIDYGLINGKAFFCTAGLGFDAKIGHKFAKKSERGFYSYFKAVIEEFFSYKSKKYKITIDGQKLKERAFLVTIANASQYGNNAFISPDAVIDDGLLDVCVLRPFPKNRVIGLGVRLFKRTLDQSPYLDIKRGKEIIVKRKKKGPVHYDGEPIKMDKKIRVSVVHSGLKVIVNHDVGVLNETKG